tara:strand:+ start:1058 stop:1591 length:534 start_codon:yes stop_codon:yes gene_type:complete
LKLIYLVLFLSVNLFSNLSIAQSIVVVNVQDLIDNNKIYQETIKELEINQEKYIKKFEKKEKEIQQILSDIEEAKLILNENEINNQIENYNNQLNNFTILVDNFNLHFQEQIIKIREKVLKEIIYLLENYAIENNIDLILDSTSYLIASNSIDISDYISNELKKINLQLEYKDFEKY